MFGLNHRICSCVIHHFARLDELNMSLLRKIQFPEEFKDFVTHLKLVLTFDLLAKIKNKNAALHFFVCMTYKIKIADHELARCQSRLTHHATADHFYQKIAFFC